MVSRRKKSILPFFCGLLFYFIICENIVLKSGYHDVRTPSSSLKIILLIHTFKTINPTSSKEDMYSNYDIILIITDYPQVSSKVFYELR